MVSSSTSNRKSKSKSKGRSPFLRKRSLVGGRYSVLKKLSEGAFGHTLLAEDTHLPGNPRCVLKQLKPQSGNRAMETARRLFEQEAQVLYILGHHSQIPQLLAHFEDRDGFYLAQEYIEGRSLSQELKQNVPCSAQQTIQLLKEILEVLVFVHQQQVIHRDLKPANLIRRKRDGKIVMIDFGAVKQVGSQFLNPRPGETDYTIAIGTVGYIPNEQLGGRPRYSSDIYAVGMLGIQALSGISPTDLDDDDRTGEILWRDRVPPICDDFAAILERMVSYDFRARYTTAVEALNAIQTLVAGGGTTPTSPIHPSRVHNTGIFHAPAELPLPPTENQSEVRPLPSHPQASAFAPEANHAASPNPSFNSGWVGAEQPSQLSWSQTSASFLGPWTQIQQHIQDRGMAIAVHLWHQRHWFNPWYGMAFIALMSTMSMVEWGVWFSSQQNRLYSANSVPSETVLDPAERLVKNLPALNDLNDLSTQLSEQISTYMDTAQAAIDSGDDQKALEAYQKVLSFDDQNHHALTQRCTILSNLDEPTSALSACQELELVRPKDVVALWGLGKANQDMAQYEEALDYYNQALDIDPGYSPAWNGREVVLQAIQAQS